MHRVITYENDEQTLRESIPPVKFRLEYIYIPLMCCSPAFPALLILMIRAETFWTCLAIGITFVVGTAIASYFRKHQRLIVQEAIDRWQRMPSRTLQLTFTDQGLESVSSVSRTQLSWDLLDAIQGDSRGWTVFILGDAYWIPADLMDQELKEFLQSKALEYDKVLVEK